MPHPTANDRSMYRPPSPQAGSLDGAPLDPNASSYLAHPYHGYPVQPNYASAPWYPTEYRPHSAYATSSGVHPYHDGADLVQAHAHRAAYGYAAAPASSMPSVPWINSQTPLSSPTALPQDHNPTTSTPSVLGSHHIHYYPPPVQPPTPLFSIIEQETYTYTTQFSQNRYSNNWMPATISFRRAGMTTDGVSVAHLLNGGDADLIDANHRVSLPESAEDHIAAIVTLCILIPGCERFSGRIHIVRRHAEAEQAGVVTVADLACQIAKHIDRFLKTPSGRAWAVRERMNINQIMLLDFHRVKKGTWQVTLGKQTVDV
ncbi:hypothetical protein EWM64_g5018 [Hericium alpestre]|uniref:Uncharacterized protein n=1 Tax=Hericium alpestre TaxID=135208 RepID=A0A4Y9ZXR3_9AGAM|nr:hypothetical protein EWM64_g5018 [Hericium alpestre]